MCITIKKHDSKDVHTFYTLTAVFVIDSDIGVSTIVGSALFNLLFVLGVCGIVSPVCTMRLSQLSQVRRVV